MRHGLIRKKSRRFVQHSQSFESERPIQPLKEENESGVDGILFFARIRDQPLIARELIIGEIKCRRGVRLSNVGQLVRSRKKQDIRIGVECRIVDWERHEKGKLFAGGMSSQIRLTVFG